MIKINLKGRRFGKLTVGRECGRTAEGRVLWHCRCDCGENKIVASSSLRSGSTASCGCLCVDAARARANYHGLSHSKTMSTWSGVITRCFNRRSKDFKRYGARGITACEAIKKNVMGIFDAVGERPAGKTLDRKNNAGNYTCGRCAECKNRGWTLNLRWATPRQQGRNTSKNHRVTINGVTHCIVEWAEISGLQKVTILARINRGWPNDELLRPPLTPGEKL